ncbi:heavy metal translocating P-type ATPase [Wenxinia saemankumensis]
MARPAPALETTHLLHLPDIHCGACIAGVERALGAAPGVRAARVNLTRKRVAITAPGLDAATLVAALAEAGYRAQPMDAARTGADRTPRDLLTRIGVAGFAMMNVMLLSVAVWSGATGATAQVFHLVSAAIAIPAVAYAAQPFFGSALQALRARRLNMDVPIALAILLASLASLAAAFDLAPNDGWFDAALALTFFLLIGRYLDTAGRAAARSAAADLAALDVPQAIRLEDGRERVVPAADLAPGDLILLRPGDRLPADGEIVSGRCDLDRSALTGESQPAPAGPGDPVAAGETCLTGALTVRVLRAGRDTALARMAETIAAAEGQRTRYAGLADRAARLYAPAVHLLGAGTFLGWLAATGDGWRALDVAISVLVITCPCALGLAVPAVSTVATGRLFRAGLLVKSPTALERLSEVDIVAFDKTGTLTTGTPRLAVRPDDAALAAAAGLARHSAHPMSRAIVAAAEAAGLAPAPVRDIAEHPGDGVEGWLDGRRLRLGRAAFAGGAGDGLWLGRDGTAPVALPMAETLRPGAAPATAALAAAGYGTALLSGDAAGPVRRLAAETGIAEAHADLRPADKTAWVEARQDEGHRVLMVGDGLNDTGPLAVAHAGLSPGSALDAARSASDVVALSGDVGAVPLLLRTARGAMARMRQNIGLALAYNAISIPLAVTGHASPLVAALAMSASSLTVTLNAMRRL